MLTEGDDPQDPIADAARAILDGHILLSRRVADSGLYPAIDVESSVSRVVTEIADEPWRQRIRKLKRLVSAYSANRDLIAIGAYQRGNDAATDEARNAGRKSWSSSDRTLPRPQISRTAGRRCSARWNKRVKP